MKSQMENNIRGEMEEIKERLGTLTASLEENKDEGQLWETYEDEHKFTIPRKVTVSDEHVYNFFIPWSGNSTIFIERLVGLSFLCRDLSKCNIIDSKNVLKHSAQNRITFQRKTFLAHNKVTHIVVMQNVTQVRIWSQSPTSRSAAKNAHSTGYV